MAKQENMTAFTVRLPVEMEAQIQARADISRRSRNAEILILLEQALDASTRADADLVQQLKDRT
ncbi:MULTISPECIES: Arc family DNA-binding protein [unclassified Cupriavidus]|uniref:Arc family DNA-binding protein n=1 Tax=unclassified Cupriavidus TaxID=2640874 RepID=UPI0032136463